MGKLDANKLAGSPPVYIVMYELPGVRREDQDHRHLVTRKSYYWKVAMWSTLRPADEATIRSFGVGPLASDESTDASNGEHAGRFARWFGEAFACCSAKNRGRTVSGSGARARRGGGDVGDATPTGGAASRRQL